MKVAVVGHVEWIAFHAVEGIVAPGAILHATEAWEEPGGGGGVAAVDLARQCAACTLFAGVGSDAVGKGLVEAFAPLGVALDASVWPTAQRRGLTITGSDGERTIVIVGEAQHRLGLEASDLDGFDGVYLCKGDIDAVRAARAARVLVATARILPLLQQAGVPVDALVHSAVDPAEAYVPGDLVPAPTLVCTTEGARGGRWRTVDGRSGRWDPAPLPGPVRDAYGCGDSFAAGLTAALARGLDPAAACAHAATRGALALTRRGAHGV